MYRSYNPGTQTLLKLTGRKHCLQAMGKWHNQKTKLKGLLLLQPIEFLGKKFEVKVSHLGKAGGLIRFYLNVVWINKVGRAWLKY